MGYHLHMATATTQPTDTKPRIRPLGDGMQLTFADGRTAHVWPTGGGMWGGLVYRGDDVVEEIRAWGQEHTVRAAAVADVSAPAPLAVDPAAIAEAAEADIDGAVKVLRKLLKQRTGRTWSVRRGRGTGYGWLTIDAPPRRTTARGYLSLEDHATLASIFGTHATHQGVSIRTGAGVRAWYACTAAGVELPSGVHVSERSWD